VNELETKLDLHTSIIHMTYVIDFMLKSFCTR